MPDVLLSDVGMKRNVRLLAFQNSLDLVGPTSGSDSMAKIVSGSELVLGYFYPNHRKKQRKSFDLETILGIESKPKVVPARSKLFWKAKSLTFLFIPTLDKRTSGKWVSQAFKAKK